MEITCLTFNANTKENQDIVLSAYLFEINRDMKTKLKLYEVNDGEKFQLSKKDGSFNEDAIAIPRNEMYNYLDGLKDGLAYKKRKE